ncbi:MAG: hypothetical protein Q9M23_07545, partial [Mariprofundaceae bacterium]|nr:hypothetical protein [Mariprofundaceae bacterium]
MNDQQMLDVIAVGPLQSLSFAMLRDDAGWLVQKHAFRYPLRGVAGAPASLQAGIPWQLYGVAMADPSRPLYLANAEVEAIHDFIRAPSDLHLDADKSSMLAGAERRMNIHIAAHVDL